MTRQKTVVAAALGECVHVAGVRAIENAVAGELTQFVNDGLRCWEERQGSHCRHCAHGRAIN